MEKYMSGKSDREKEYVYRVLDAAVSNLGVLLNGECRNADEISLLFNQFTISLLFCVIVCYQNFSLIRVRKH